jgi:hypothetical protein
VTGGVVPWGDYSPDQVETLISALIMQMVTGAQRIEGAGGDGGADVVAPVDGGEHVFEIKSFLQLLTKGHKSQIRKSLKQAVACRPDMVHWTLFLPKDLTPGEVRWFNRDLRPLAPSVSLDWVGRTAIEAALSERPWLLRAFAPGSPPREALEMLAELHAEEAGMPRGMVDGIERAQNLRRRIGDLDPDYDFDLDLGQDTTTIHVQPRTADALIRRPPTVGISFQAPEGSPVAAMIQQMLRYGRPADIPAEYVSAVELNLPGNLNELIPTGAQASVSLSKPEEEAHWRQPGRLHAVREGRILATLPVQWTDRSQGALGGSWLSGRDSSGWLEVRACTEPDRTGEIHIEAPASDDVLPAEALPALRFLQHLTRADHLNFQMPGNPITEARITGSWVPVPAAFLPVAEALARIQEASGVVFPMPNRLTHRDAEMLHFCDQILRHGHVDWYWPGAYVPMQPSAVRQLFLQGPLPRLNISGDSSTKPRIRLMGHDIPLPAPLHMEVTNVLVMNPLALATDVDSTPPHTMLVAHIGCDVQTRCTFSLADLSQEDEMKTATEGPPANPA